MFRRLYMTRHQIILTGAIVIALGASGCGASKITDEQLAQIRELRKQQSSINDKMRTMQGDIARLEAELADRQKTVDKCKEEKSAVEQRLARWPNIWPDAAPADTTKNPPKK